MQKKSLLVALFCGALCLTGCIKNEESASVAQVRIAKANELNSIADLNKAKAAAEGVYAQAELILAEAEKALKEAESNLVNAQAETEKVRAELLKVRVQLQTVKVEEEKIELQKKEAELEVYLAQAEAAKAAAEAAQQYWINKLEDLLAQAEITALENAKAYMDAENEILKLQGERADSAKVYAQLYFQALDSVAKYQVMEIEVKVAKVLVERKAPEIRDAIYGFIDENDEKIAENNAKIEAYKKYQTMTPEEAEEKYQAATTAAGEAYTAWKEASDAVTAASTAVKEAHRKTADFTVDWETKFDIVEAEVPGIGEKTIKGVNNHGINGKDGEFITLWSDEKVKITPVAYPNIDVYAKGERTSVDEVTIVPATIEYDNIKEVLDTAVARREAFANMGVAFAEFFTDLQIASLEEKVANLEEGIAAHEKYVKAMKDSVDKYEKAYLDSLAKSKEYAEGAESAWEEFQEYMLYTYPTVSREMFATRAQKQKAYDAAKKASDEAKKTYDNMVGNIPGFIDDVVDAHDDYETAIGNYRKALYETRHDPQGDTTEAYAAYLAALEHWNPNFNVDGKTNMDDWTYPGTEITVGQLWNVDANGKVTGSDATDVQIALFVAKKRVEAAEEQLYLLEQALVRNPKGSANYQTWKDAYDAFVKEEESEAESGEYVNAYRALSKAEVDAYGKTGSSTKIGAKGKYDEAWEEVKEAVLIVQDTTVYNPFISDEDFHSIVKYPTTASSDDYWYNKTAYDKDNNVWVVNCAADHKDHVFGSAQKALADAVKNVVDAKETTAKTPAPGGDLYKAMTDANLATEGAFVELTNANEALYAEILRVTELTDGEKAEAAEFKDEKADNLYKAYKDAIAKVNSVDIEKAWNTLLKKGYGNNPDQIGTLDRLYRKPVDNVYTGDYATWTAMFGWLRSSYNVDYEATMLNPEGEEIPIMWVLYPYQQKQETHSLKYQLEQAEEDIEVNLPEMLSTIKEFWAKNVKDYKTSIANIVAKVNGYKANETGYKTWIAEREAAAKALAEAKKAEFNAKKDLNEAKAEYEAARAGLNGGVIYEVWDDSRDGAYAFKKVSINDAIEKLETENEELEKQNEKWYQTLKDGKVALGLVNEMLDEILAQVEEAIDIWAAIANKYKALMNAYLGIVEEAAVETPVVEEGEDEE